MEIKPLAVTIHFYQDITETSAKYFIAKYWEAIDTCYQHDITQINLFISSRGGCVHDSFTVYNLLAYCPFKLVTVNMGNVESSACLWQIVGDIRLTVKHSSFLIHQFFNNLSNEKLDYYKLDELSKVTVNAFDRYVDIVGSRIAMNSFTVADPDSVLNEFRNNAKTRALIFSSAEGIANGLYHGLVPEKPLDSDIVRDSTHTNLPLKLGNNEDFNLLSLYRTIHFTVL